MTTSSTTTKTHGNFDLVKSIQLENSTITLEKWQSRETGLSVAHLDVDSPLVRGYFAIPTEIFDDSGCPHTLEHLIFLGSEKYPYKGVLDNLANRAFAAGTNAWTANDHTAYTITTAGQDGFLRLLPIYIDHILYPTMTDSGFVTEVHHINEKAEDAGVVYAEMQGREQDSGDLIALENQRILYPKGSAYRSETGGLMEALRVLTAEKIRNYHKSYYLPHNLCLIIVGKMDTSTLLDVLQNKVEPSLLEHGQTGSPKGWKRPFMETASAQKPELTESISRQIKFPEKDESQGEVSISFLGATFDEMETRKALDIMGQYLTDSSVSPLVKEFIEIPSPLCTYIACGEDIRATFSAIQLIIGGVPTEELEGISDKIVDAIKKVRDEGIDMDRMATVINRDRLKFLNLLEADCGEYYASNIINDFLYGEKNGGNLPAIMSDPERYRAISGWTAQQWKDLLTKFIIENPRVVVTGKPSATLPDKLEADEKARIAAQKKQLGEEGPKKAIELLEESKKEHERPIPTEMLTSFAVPPISSISWIPVETAVNSPSMEAKSNPGAVQKHVDSDGSKLPFFVEYESTKSNFVTVTACLSTEHVPEHLLPYMSLYQMIFFSLPVTRSDGTKLDHEEVVNQLDKFTVGYETTFGLGHWYQNLFNIRMKAEPDQYENVVSWMKDLIFSSEFTKDRLTVMLAKLRQSLPEMKRDGNSVLHAVSSDLLYKPTYIGKATGLTSLLDHVKDIAQRLKDDPESVIADFNLIRGYLTKPDGIRFLVVGDILSIPKPRSPFRTFDAISAEKVSPPQMAADLLGHLGKKPSSKAVVVTLPSIESSYAIVTSKAIKGYTNPDSPALSLSCEVLDALESYFWRYIRGSGLAYGVNISPDYEAGTLSFSVYKSPDSYKAFAEARRVVEGLVDGSIPLEETIIDSAKSSLVYATTREVSTAGRAASNSFLNQALKGVSQTYGRENLEKIRAVTVEEVKESLKKYVLPLFEYKTSMAVVVSSPAKTKDIATSLETFGYHVEIRDFGTEEDFELDGDGESDYGSTDESAKE